MTTLEVDKAPQTSGRTQGVGSVGQSSKFRVGFLGTGFIADWHAKALAAIPAAQLVAVCDKNPLSARTFADRFGVPHRFDSLARMLDEAKLDAVHVLVPPELHAAMALQIVKAGVGVLLEKPMCTNREDCQNLIDCAAENNVQLGVSHNFLFLPAYEQLRSDLEAGKLGRIDQVTINWSRELPQIVTGPYNSWLHEQPENLILEVGPHSVAHLFDLLGQPTSTPVVSATNPKQLPGNRTCYRRWLVDYQYPTATARLIFSFVPGYTEHTIHVRGSSASATADLENWTYTLARPTPFQSDANRYLLTRRAGRGLRRQARVNLYSYVASKLKLSQRGNHFGYSIQRSLARFYDGCAAEIDERIDGEAGRDAVSECLRIGKAAGIAANPAPPVHPGCTGRPEILILGGTGFIGRALVRHFTGQGQTVRLLVRNASRIDESFDHRLIQIQQGDLHDSDAVDRAVEGMSSVYHLARAYANNWQDFQQHDIPLTELIAEACLKHNVDRMIYTGTIDSYYAGSRAGTITAATPLDPKIDSRKPYARAKAFSEELLMQLHHRRDLPLVIFRPGIVIGSGGHPMHWGVGMFIENSIARLWGGGRNKLPLVLVQDVAAGLAAAHGRNDLSGESFNLVGDPLLNAHDYVECLARAAESELRIVPTSILQFYAIDVLKYLVKVLVRHPGRYRPTYRDWESRTQKAQFDCQKTKDILGWSPVSDRGTLIRQGIEEPAREFLH